MQFRAYFIDENEYVRGALDLKANTPEEAIDKAQSLRNRQTVEVWQVGVTVVGRDRLLQRYEAL